MSAAQKIDAVKIRVNIAGYGHHGEPPASVLCAYDRASGVLAVIEDRAMEMNGRPGWLLVSNQRTDANCDAFFSQDMLRDAITAFFNLDSLGLISIGKKAERARPASKIESDGMDERGVKYRIKDDCGNRHVAVLAAAWFADTQRNIGAALDDLDEFHWGDGGDSGGDPDDDDMGAFTV